MAYVKTVWVDNSTPPINATNLNNIENGIENNGITINNIKGFILWENEDKSVSITTKTIELNSSDYDEYEVLYRYSISSESMVLASTGRIPKGYGTRMQLSYAIDGNLMIRDRNINYLNNTHLGIGENIGNDDDANAIIPYYVIGYKTGLFE